MFVSRNVSLKKITHCLRAYRPTAHSCDLHCTALKEFSSHGRLYQGSLTVGSANESALDSVLSSVLQPDKTSKSPRKPPLAGKAAENSPVIPPEVLLEKQERKRERRKRARERRRLRRADQAILTKSQVEQQASDVKAVDHPSIREYVEYPDAMTVLMMQLQHLLPVRKVRRTLEFLFLRVLVQGRRKLLLHTRAVSKDTLSPLTDSLE